jgi:myo-inositol-1(or 4)-monophosphatase
MPSHSALITVMQKAARKAAPRLRRDFNEVEQLQVSRKGPSDFVSNADRAAEATIMEVLRQARPDFGFLVEEQGEIKGQEGRPRWIVDPLDGTTNFLHGIPHFAIAIAVEEPRPDGRGEIVAGVIYQPLTDETFWAERNSGAWLHDRRLRVSARRDLGECVIATGIPFQAHGDYDEHAAIMARVSPQIAGVRRFGSSALDLAWVAAGRYDGYWEADLHPWDWAAGMLMVREAGGFVTDYRGGDRMLERSEVVAGNGEIHAKLHKLIAGAVRDRK